MFFLNIILICLVSFSFCQERPNQNVGQLRYRIKRVPEKILEEIHQLIQNNSNYHQTHKEKLGAHSSLQPVHPNINLRSKKSNNKVVKKILVTPRPPIQKNVVMKQNIANTPSLFNKDKLKSMKTAKETAHSQHKIITKPRLFIEDPVDDIKPADKPQCTTQNQKADSQIEKPIANNQDDTVVFHDTADVEENKSTHSKNNLHKTSVLLEEKSESDDDDETDQVIHRMKPHKSDPDNEKNDNVPLSTTVSHDMQVQIEKPVVDSTKNSDTPPLNNNISEESAHVIGNRRKLNKKNDEQQTENEQKIEEQQNEELMLTENTRRLLLPLKGKELKIVPLSPPKTNRRVKNEPRNKIPSKPVFEEIDNNTKKNDDVSGILKPLVDCMKNETVEVIEIKQRNVTEVIERQPPLIESKESFYSTPAPQPYGSQASNIEYQDGFRPDITYLPSPYKYTYSNPYQDGFWYSNPSCDNSHSLLNADALKKTWRTWVDTNISIKTTKSPYDKCMQKVLFSQFPRKEGENNENNFFYKSAKPTMYTSYPCYVYPNTGYTPTHGYYNS